MKTKIAKNVLVVIGRVAIAGIVFALPRLSRTNVVSNEVGYSDGYYDVVKVIMNSDMFDSNKRECISAMKKHASPGYYRAVTNIVESDMFDSIKIDTIRSL